MWAAHQQEDHEPAPVSAHSLSTRADAASFRKQWGEAKELYRQAAVRYVDALEESAAAPGNSGKPGRSGKPSAGKEIREPRSRQALCRMVKDQLVQLGKSLFLLLLLLSVCCSP
jgi:hypothetical protein